MVARGAGAAGPVLLACRQWDPLGLARRLPSLGFGAWRCASLLPWQVQCPVCVCAALAARRGVRAGTWCCVSLVSPFPPRVFRAACGGPSRPGVPYPRSLVRHSTRSVRSARSVRLPLWLSPRAPFVCVRSRSRGVRSPPPSVVWRAHLAWSRRWALVRPFHVVRAPPRGLPRSLAPSGVLGGGAVWSRFPPTWLGVVGVAVGRPRGGCLGASGVGRSPGPDCPPSGRAAGAGVGRPGSGALPPPTARPLGGLPGPLWGVQGRTLSQPRLPALWVGCRGRCGASGVGRSPTPDCSPSGRAAGAGVGRPGWDALPPLAARPLGGLLGPVWGVQGGALSHPRLPALWAGCRGRCGASGVGRSPSPDCPPSGRAAVADVGRPGSGALPPPTARPLGGLPGPVLGVRGRALPHPRLPALWAGCRGRCGASGVGRSPTPNCSPSGRAAGAGVGRPGSGTPPPPTARPLGGLPGPGVGRPGSDALPPPTARPLGGLPGPVWGVRGRALSHPRLPALWAGCRGRCRASGVGRSPSPDCSPSGRAAGAGVGRPGSDALPTPTARPLGGLPGPVGRPGSGALPPPTARPLGGLPGPVWGVRGRTLSHPRLPALWAGCWGRCGASGVGRSPTPDCSPSGRAAGAGVGRPGSDALPPPTARPLGGLPGPVWGVRGRALSHPRLPALWAGCRGRCWASGVGRSPTPDCPPSGRAAGAGVGRPGSDALPPPTARPLGGLLGPVWGVRGRTLSHPRKPALWAGCRGRCGASGVGRSPTPNCPPSGRADGAGVGRPGSGAPPPPTARPLGGLPGPVWGVRGRTLPHPRLPALWPGCRGRCGASGVGRSPCPNCSPSGRAAGAGVGRPGSGALPPPTARPLGGLPGPVWGVQGRTLSHPRLPALWAGCWGRCGASGVGRSPTPDCPPSGRAAGAGVGRPGSDALPPPTARPSWRAAGAGVGRPGSDALPPPTARPLGGLPGPPWGVRGRALSHPRLPALWAGCRRRCGASGVGRSPTPDCSPSGRAAGAGVGRPGSGALPPPTARPLGGLLGPVWGVRGRTLSHHWLPALWTGCRGRCGASRVGRSPPPDCSPSGRAAGAGVGRPGSGALPPPTARPLGGLLGPVWGVWGRTLSRPRLPALWAGCQGRCGASEVGRSPTPDCLPSGRLPGPVWGVRGRALSQPRLPALSAGCRGRCGASGVGRSPTPDCPPSGRAAGAGVGRPGSGSLPAPTARSLGGLPGPVWGVRGRALSHPRLLALWAGCWGRCGASGVGRSPNPDCPPSGRAAGAGVGRPGSDALPPPTARPLGGLLGPVWGVRGRTLSHPRKPALWAGCRGRCGASGVGRSPTPNCPPSGRADGAGVGRPGSGAPPPPTARPLGGLPGPVWGVRGRTLPHPRLPALWPGCRGRCGASGVGRSPCPNCSPSGRAAGAGVGRPGSGALPPPTARPLGGLPGPVWGVQGRTLSHPRLPALWAGCWGRCGASGVGRSPTPDCPPSGRAAGAGVGRPGSDALPPPTARPSWRAAGAGVGRPGSDALPPPTARPLGGLPGPPWGVRGRALSHPRLPALWAGCRRRCGASGVGRSPTPDCSPSGRAAGAGVGRPGSGALPPPTARPLGGLLGPVWGVRGRTLSHHWLPALWTGCRGRCGASGVGRSPPPDCSPSGRAAGAGVGRPGSGALPPPTARPLGGLLGPVWGVWGRTLSRPRLPALWAGCQGRCGASEVGRSPTPDCLPSGRLPGPVWGVRGRALSQPRLPALSAGCRGRCGASGVGRSPTPDCPPSGRAAGAGVGRPGSGSLPAPTARSLGGLPGPVWGVPGRALSHPRLPALWAGCWGRCGASGVGLPPTPDCPFSGRVAGAGVGRPGSGALPPPTARPLCGLPGPVRGVRGLAHPQPRVLALWTGCRGRCEAVQRAGSRGWESVRPRTPHTGPGSPLRGRAVGVGRASDPGRPTPAQAARPEGGQSGVGERPTPDAPHRPRQPAQRAGSQGRESVQPRTPHTGPGSPPGGRAVGGGRASNPGRPTPAPAAGPEGGQSGVGERPTPDAPHRPQQPAQRAGSRGWESVRPRTPHTGPGSPPRGRAVGGGRASDPGRPTPAPAARPEGRQWGVGERPT